MIVNLYEVGTFLRNFRFICNSYCFFCKFIFLFATSTAFLPVLLFICNFSCFFANSAFYLQLPLIFLQLHIFQ